MRYDGWPSGARVRETPTPTLAAVVLLGRFIPLL